MPSVSHLLRPDIAALEAYTPIEPFEVLAERLGLPVEQIVKLDANENPYGPSPLAIAALASYQHYAIYPDPNHTALRRALSEYTEQPVERIICGAGGDDIIDLLVRAFLEPGDSIIDCTPTFGMYSFDTGVQGGHVINVARTATFDLDLPTIEEVVGIGPKILFLTSPNNPTGNLTPRADILRLLQLPLLVVVDEAYIEFSGTTVADLVGQYPNLVVLRTFSKWAGLAGLRVGYGLMHEEIIGALWKIKQPYNVNVAAEQAALASLRDLEYLQANVARIVMERERVFDLLHDMPELDVFPSRSNFILARVRAGGAGALKTALMKRGVLLRYYNKPGLNDCVRMSIGTPEQNDAALAALREELAAAPREQAA